MEYNIFYSWQSDSPRRCNKDFIREALDTAVATKRPTIVDTPRVESGMDRVPGTPEVATVMFDKIRKSSIFVADVTLVGTINPSGSSGEPKRTANPNVLLEMGYAAGTMGWSRIVCVMNEHFGKREDQPVDVRNRRYPINYTLDPSQLENKTRLEAVKKELVDDLQLAIEALEIAECVAVDEAMESLDINCTNQMVQTGRCPWFSIKEPSTRGEQLDALFPLAVINRLIDLHLLVARYAPQQNRYAYHWTYIGKLVLVKLNIRSSIDDCDPPPGTPPINIGKTSIITT